MALTRIAASEDAEALMCLINAAFVVERFFIDGHIDRPPPNFMLGIGMLHDSLVLGRATGLQTGVGDERSIFCDTCVFLVAKCMLIELAWRKISMNLRDC
jgi:hypothetical protein